MSKNPNPRSSGQKGDEKEAPALPKEFTPALAAALGEVFSRDRHADKALEALFAHQRYWEDDLRRLAAEAFYALIREWRLHWYLLGKAAPGVSNAPLPEGVSVGERYLPVVRLWIGLNRLGSLNGVGLPPRDEIFTRLEEAGNSRAVSLSLPDWLDELGAKALGNEMWADEMAGQLEGAPLVLRANTLVNSSAELRALLKLEKWHFRSDDRFPDALIMPKGGNPFRLAAFREGRFEVQDTASQLVAPFLQPEPGMRVVDACAGAGGKTLHIAALMENKGQILALDTDERKLAALKQRARRAGVHNIEAKPIEDTKILKRLAGTADRLLLDVPCSGLGVLRRNPDIKWRLRPESLIDILNTQAEILDKYCGMVKPGGKLVYATCSLLPQENEAQIQKFLTVHPEFSLEAEQRTSPAKDGADGFYMARLIRAGGNPEASAS